MDSHAHGRGGELPQHDEVRAIQLQTLDKIVSKKQLTFFEHVILRFKSEFFGQSFKRKIWFISRALHWALNMLRAKFLRAAVRASPVTLPVKPDDEILRVAVHGTGSLGDFCSHALFIQEFYRRFGPMHIDFFAHPKKIEDAKFLFSQVHNIKNVVDVTFLPALERSYDLIVYIRFLVKYRVIHAARVLRHSADLLNTVGRAESQFEPYTLFFEHHPLLDGMMARGSTLKGMNLADLVGHTGKIDVNRKTKPLLIPDLAAVASFQRSGLLNKRYITVHDGYDTSYVPTGESVTKCWPIGHWSRFVQLFKKQFPDIAVIQLGASTSRKIEGVDIDMRNKTTLPEAIWALKQSLLHVDGESGLVRIAHAVHTKSVVLFGPTNKLFFSLDSNINLSASACGDCWWSTNDWLSRCPRSLANPECMDSIAPEQVLEHVSAHLNSLTSPCYDVDTLALYRNGETDRKFVADMCNTLRIPLVPISAKTENREDGFLLDASKQWEYSKAWKVIDKMAAELGRPLKIADVGGGRGAFSPYLAKMGHEVEVFDLDYLWDHRGDPGIEHRFQRWARENGLKVSLGSLFNVPAESRAYDIVLSVSVLEHIPHKDFALKEALRLLRPGGKLIMSFDFMDEGASLEDSLRVEIFTPERLNTVLSAAGIEQPKCSLEAVKQSKSAIQNDQVYGIPAGMTVGSLTITRA